MSKSAHIVIVGPAHPLRGGIAAFNERMAMALIAAGHRVTIFTFSYQYPGFLFPGKTQYSTDPGPAGIDIRVCVHSLNPLNWLSVAKEIAALKPDHLLLRFWIPFMAPCLGSIGRMVRKRFPVRITGLLDNVIPHEKRPGDTALIRYFTNTCDDFLSMSHQVTRDLRQFSDRPCRYSPHPVYDQYGQRCEKTEACRILGLDPNQNYLLFFGLIRHYKGLDLLLEAFGKSTHTREKYHLLIAGEFYEDKAPYEQLIRQYGLEERVHLHDYFIPDEKVKYYFSAADLITQTYRTATQSGISQLAFHFEKPMLVTNVGGLGEIIHHQQSGLVATPDSESIMQNLELFSSYDNPELFREAIREEKKKYSWEAFTEVLLS